MAARKNNKKRNCYEQEGHGVALRSGAFISQFDFIVSIIFFLRHVPSLRR